jgi:hypothetical protein
MEGEREGELTATPTPMPMEVPFDIPPLVVVSVAGFAGAEDDDAKEPVEDTCVKEVKLDVAEEDVEVDVGVLTQGITIGWSSRNCPTGVLQQLCWTANSIAGSLQQ